MRDNPTAVAPPYMSGPTIHVERGHQRAVSLVTAAAAANAVDVWPDGNDVQSPERNPRPNAKSSGSSPSDRNGRARPASHLMTVVIDCENTTASVPCQPRSATRSLRIRRPTMYIVPPM